IHHYEKTGPAAGPSTPVLASRHYTSFTLRTFKFVIFQLIGELVRQLSDQPIRTLLTRADSL
ncbi:hypothetical protein Hamer_G019784, partial [Homarus americanus]